MYRLISPKVSLPIFLCSFPIEHCFKCIWVSSKDKLVNSNLICHIFLNIVVAVNCVSNKLLVLVFSLAGIMLFLLCSFVLKLKKDALIFLNVLVSVYVYYIVYDNIAHYKYLIRTHCITPCYLLTVLYTDVYWIMAENYEMDYTLNTTSQRLSAFFKYFLSTCDIALSEINVQYIQSCEFLRFC